MSDLHTVYSKQSRVPNYLEHGKNVLALNPLNPVCKAGANPRLTVEPESPGKSFSYRQLVPVLS